MELLLLTSEPPQSCFLTPPPFDPSLPHPIPETLQGHQRGRSALGCGGRVGRGGLGARA